MIYTSIETPSLAMGHWIQQGNQGHWSGLFADAYVTYWWHFHSVIWYPPLNYVLSWIDTVGTNHANIYRPWKGPVSSRMCSLLGAIKTAGLRLLSCSEDSWTPTVMRTTGFWLCSSHEDLRTGAAPTAATRLILTAVGQVLSVSAGAARLAFSPFS